MVDSNTVLQHRKKALEILRSSSTPVPVHMLAGELGVTRVALWKLVRKLQELGYPIRTSREGYLLPKNQDPDLLCPWELDTFGGRIEWFPSTSSTMEESKRFSGSEDLLICTVAETQTAGRGRFHRPWESPPGGIYLTLTWTRHIPLAVAGRYPLLAGVSWIQTLEELFPHRFGHSSRSRISLKWPNDILAGGKKIGGVLLDMDVEGDTVTRIHLGIGLNIRNRPRDPNAIALVDLMGSSIPPRRRILSSYLHRMERALKDPYLKGIIPEWKRFSSTLGKRVRIRFPGGRRAGIPAFEGIAEDIGPGGELLVRTSDGSPRAVHYGDCHHLI
ncbi:MAG: biotin--[acetyl-CoA-carboxylase] ligase [Spirochaetales bacterium]